LRAYFDTVIVSGITRRDLQPPAEMAATLKLVEADEREQLEIVTSRWTRDEQGRTKNSLVRLRLLGSQLPVVEEDSRILGINIIGDGVTGGRINAPILTEIVNAALFDAFTAAGLKTGDARHLMYAVHNGCNRFVTLDEDFLGPRRVVLEQSTRSLRIVRPTELVAELGC
jgi:predicted nucleic acid-binding protein